MANTLITADFHLAANVSGNFTTEVTLHLELSFDVFTKNQELVVGEIFDAIVGVNTRGSKRLL